MLTALLNLTPRIRARRECLLAFISVLQFHVLAVELSAFLRDTGKVVATFPTFEYWLDITLCIRVCERGGTVVSGLNPRLGDEVT